MFREKIISVFLILSLFTLPISFQSGAGEGSGSINAFALILRGQLWIGISLLLAFFLRPSLFAPNISFLGVNERFAMFSWPAFFLLMMISSSLSILYRDVGVSFVDTMKAVEIVMCSLLVLVVFSLTKSSHQLRDVFATVFLLVPILHLLAVLFLTPEHVAFLGGNFSAGEFWFIGYGGRFIGLSGNSNSVAMQCCIAFGIGLGNLITAAKVKSFSIAAKRFVVVMYLIGLLALIFLTGVRAALLSIGVMLALFFVCAKRALKVQILTLVCFSLLGLFLAEAAGVIDIATISVLQVLQERLSEGDGRLHLWANYMEQVLLNPFGFGITFENVVDVTQLAPEMIHTVRLTPHNMFLEAGIYGGLLGATTIFLCILAISLMIFSLITKNIQISGVQFGLCFAIVGLWVNLFFGGMIFNSFEASFLVALLLAMKHTYNVVRANNYLEAQTMRAV